MIIPTSTLRFAFAGGFTAVTAAVGLLRHMAGDEDAVRRVAAPWARGLARGIGMQVQVHGAGRLDPARSYVFLSNHQSNLDVVALCAALPTAPGFLAKQELRRVPIFGRAMEAGGHVFVDRRDRARAFEAIARAAARIREGGPIAVFPEGTRSEVGAIRPFKKGGFHLARQARVPVVPVGVRGTARLLPKKRWLIHPGQVSVHIGEPIGVDEVARLSVGELIEVVRRRISELSAMPLVESRGDPG